MPKSALERVQADYVVPVAEMPALLTMLTASPTGTTPNGADSLTQEGTDPVDRDLAPTPRDTEPSPLEPRAVDEKANGTALGLSCPDCHGSLWELSDGPFARIECRVGHAFSVDAFLGAQSIALEEAIWSAINALEERASTLRPLRRPFRRGAPHAG